MADISDVVPAIPVSTKEGTKSQPNPPAGAQFSLENVVVLRSDCALLTSHRLQRVPVFLSFLVCLSFPQNAYVNINRIMSVASRLAEAGHYASAQIKQISGQLDQDWKSFAAALDERSTILAMSSVFHQKAERVSATTRSRAGRGQATARGPHAAHSAF